MASRLVTMATRWGIASAGFISGDFVRAVQLLPRSDHQVIAIAARDQERSNEFAKTYNLPKAYNSYEQLANDPEIDVVYIGSIHPTHAEIAKLMLNAGKHVLCEKPLCMNPKQVTEVTELAKAKKLFLMEAYWVRFFPVYEKIRQTLKDGSVGEPLVLNAHFGFPLSGVKRVRDPSLGGGALLDVGCYPLQIAELVFGGKPDKIVASTNKLETGVDGTTALILTYPGNRMAVLTCSVTCELNQKAIIQCTDGIIEIPAMMWCPTEVIVKGEKFTYPLPADPAPFHFHHGSGMAYEAQHVRERILNGDLESPIITHEMSLNISRIAEEGLRQVGVKYDFL